MSPYFPFLRLILIFFIVASLTAGAQTPAAKLITIGDGWANNTVNTTVFRKNSLVTFDTIQYTAYYNKDAYMVLGSRRVGSDTWTIKQTNYKGRAGDAHNVISIMVDGDGILHVSWDHHNNSLNYARSLKPGSLDLGEKMSMIGRDEKSVSYPEFYKLRNGNLLFLYRSGGSGRGNLVINQYDVRRKQWTRLHDNLISGEGNRSAYWQACVDQDGGVHISWVWRESPNVASNHDMGYAVSKDGGLTWQSSTGKKYGLPITASSTEYALKIPQNSDLMNQTSMDCDEKGNPFIISYWRESQSAFPQYHLIYNNGLKWNSYALNFRKTDFSLNGIGTKRIPISRPQVLVKGKGEKASVIMIFRDEERGGRPSVLTIKKVKSREFTLVDLMDTSLGSWEPTYDTELWKQSKVLNLFVQDTQQKDGEGLLNMDPSSVKVLEWTPVF